MSKRLINKLSDQYNSLSDPLDCLNESAYIPPSDEEAEEAIRKRRIEDRDKAEARKAELSHHGYEEIPAVYPKHDDGGPGAGGIEIDNYHDGKPSSQSKRSDFSQWVERSILFVSDSIATSEAKTEAIQAFYSSLSLATKDELWASDVKKAEELLRSSKVSHIFRAAIYFRFKKLFKQLHEDNPKGFAKNELRKYIIRGNSWNNNIPEIRSVHELMSLYNFYLSVRYAAEYERYEETGEWD